MHELPGHGFEVDPGRLLASANGVRLVAGQFGVARLDAARAFDDVQAAAPGSPTAHAAGELAAAANGVLGALGAAVEDLARALRAAAERYIAADTPR